jgi:ABC-type transport system substrate-binding protein
VSQLQHIGVVANLRLQEPSVYWDGVSTGKWPMVIFSAFNEEDPELFLSLYFETGVTKRLDYSVPWLDEAMKALRLAFDPDAQDELARAINARIYEELMPTVPLYHPQGLYGVSDRLAWKPQPNEEMYFQHAKLK